MDPRATTALAAGQDQLAASALGLASTQQVLNSAVAQGIPLLDADTLATEADAAAKRDLAASSALATASTRNLGRAQVAGIAAGKALAVAQAEVAGASSAVAAAQIQFTRSSAAVVSAQKFLEASLGSNVGLLQLSAIRTLDLAKAQEAAALTALEQARALHALELAQAARQTQALEAGLLGLRTALGSRAIIGLSAAALGAIALGQALRASSQLAAQFETQMNVLGATTGASAEQLNQAAEAARQLGEDTSLPAVSAGDAAQAITELSKAGLDLQNSITGARGVLELATAAQLDNAQATEIAANALNAFQLAADQTTHVADVLANSSIAAQGSIADVGLALQQSAAAAAQVGVSFDDTIALLTLLAQGGLRASDAGTSLRVALLRLAAPTREAQQILRQLNIQVRDTAGNIRPEVFAEFQQAVSGLPKPLQDAAAAAVFGQDAFRAFSLIAREGTAGLAETRSELERQGAAADLAGAKTQGFAGALGALQSEAETLGASLGQLLNTSLLPMIGALTGLVGAANRGAEALRKLGAVDIPGLGKISSLLGDLFKVIGPLAVFRLPVQGIEQFTNAVQGAGTVTDQLTKKLANTRDALNLALATGRTDQVAALSRQIGALERALDALGGTAGKSLGKGILATSDVETTRAEQSLRARFDEIGDAVSRTAEQSGEQIGNALGAGVKKGLDQSVIDAINSAKRNLLSIGQDLAGQIGQLIDAGPLGQQIERLQGALTARQQARQRLGLVQDLEDAQRQLKLAQVDAGKLGQELQRLNAQLDRLRQQNAGAGAAAALRQAQAELRDARESVTGVGEVTPKERQSIQEFLAPFIENVRSAKSTLQQQNLEGRIQKLNDAITKRKQLFTEDDVAVARRRVAAIQQAIKDFDDAAVIANLQKTITAQKKAVQDGIANLITQFEQGEIKFAQFAARLGRLVGPYRTAGAALGAAAGAAFNKTFQDTIEQAKQIAIGPTSPKAAGVPGAQIVSPQAALLEAQKNTADNTAATAEAIKKLPEQIAAALRRPPPAGKAAAGSPR